MRIIATDLDRTLIPNGPQKLSKDAMEKLKLALKKNKIKLIFVTGRTKPLVLAGIKQHDNQLLQDTVVYGFFV